MKIGLLLIATNKYDVFVQQLIDSVDKFFFRNDNITIYLFTDKKIEVVHSDRISVVTIPITHEPFPLCTLHRYKYFTEARNLIDCDYLFYSDVDMRFVDEVGREILGDIVCVTHPGFYKGGWGSNGCDVRSHAFLDVQYRTDYKAGGFQGGKKEKYLAACVVMSTLISEDEKIGVMAEWHDETFWNWYLKSMAKIIKVLDAGYCYPESWHLPFVKKLLALDKEHDKLRYG